MRIATRSRAVAWIVLAAMLYAAASPLFAALRFQGSPEILAQICTLSGPKVPSPAPSGPSHGGHLSLEHCVFCLGGAWQPPAAQGLTVVPAVDSGTARAPTRGGSLALDFPALQPVNPRAPPRAS